MWAFICWMVVGTEAACWVWWFAVLCAVSVLRTFGASDYVKTIFRRTDAVPDHQCSVIIEDCCSDAWWHFENCTYEVFGLISEKDFAFTSWLESFLQPPIIVDHLQKQLPFCNVGWDVCDGHFWFEKGAVRTSRPRWVFRSLAITVTSSDDLNLSRVSPFWLVDECVKAALELLLVNSSLTLLTVLWMWALPSGFMMMEEADLQRLR